MGIPGGSVVKNPPANARDARDVGLTPRLGRSPGGENGTPLHYSCLKNPTHRGARQAIFKVFIECYNIDSVVYVLVFWSLGVWNLRILAP